MHVSLTEKLEEYVRETVEAGYYNNASEVIREALRLKMSKDEQDKMLREQVLLGVEQIKNGQYAEVNSFDEFLNVARSRR